MDLGVKVSINSDDPGIFDCPISGEYKVLHTECGFNEEDFYKCNKDAFEKSFIEKSKLSRFKDIFSQGLR